MAARSELIKQASPLKTGLVDIEGDQLEAEAFSVEAEVEVVDSPEVRFCSPVICSICL